MEATMTSTVQIRLIGFGPVTALTRGAIVQAAAGDRRDAVRRRGLIARDERRSRRSSCPTLRMTGRPTVAATFVHSLLSDRQGSNTRQI